MWLVVVVVAVGIWSFHHFCLRHVIAGGFASHLTSHKIKACTICSTTYPPPFAACTLSLAAGASFCISPKPSFT